VNQQSTHQALKENVVSFNTINTEGRQGGMAAALRWWESPHHQPTIVRLGMAVRSACFPAAVTLEQ
jgi:hypothetical protein